MFCPNCGASEQKTDSYCRQCGEFLLGNDEKSPFVFGGESPETQIKTSLFLNAAIGFLSFAMSIAIFAVFWNKPETYAVVYLGAILLHLIGFLQIINIIIGLKLKQRFERAKKSQLEKAPDYKEPVGLPEADFANEVPASVVEKTTRKLKTRK